MDIHHNFFGHTRTATEEEEEELLGCLQRLNRMLRLGTTLVECKSGCGLETEMKMLKVGRTADQATSKKAFSNNRTDSPQGARAYQRYGVVWRILEAGKEAGLLLNLHGDEINYMNAVELGGELAVWSAVWSGGGSPSTLLLTVAAMAKVATFAVLLPTTAYILRFGAPARSQDARSR
ncbi:uncharacterized protein ACA1_293040 [Acanthamoeba castellanii str. Neff]|uniref:Uncharacterized protein n=1 Tax=Acanthamoeba castellanii (strain ATCC 30010 / Neff) TaxID=1257118 RepID=L8HL51_ACACF|nr:uncharacterized protein ACA1_293040 [Acanthamoeba castellanii str. Neff]ELR25403.1 hypothetical protein ACA1_293040 [Acanthamoeba castellanii str. Neff]